MVKELQFDIGLASYSIGGKLEVCFNPADPVFAERLYGAIDDMGKLQDEYAKKGEALQDPKEVFNIRRERDEKMSAVLDGLFSAPVCGTVFGDMSLCAFADGFPVWLNLMLAIVDEVEANAGEIQKRADPRIKKYTEKYSKYQKMYHR